MFTVAALGATVIEDRVRAGVDGVLDPSHPERTRAQQVARASKGDGLAKRIRGLLRSVR